MQFSTKYCGHCRSNVPLEGFSRDSSSSTGLDSYCKTCRNQMRVDRRKTNLLVYRQKERTYYASHKLDYQEWDQEYKRTHKETLAIKREEYQKQNKSRLSTQNREWRKRNPTLVRNSSLERLYSITYEDLLYYLENQKNTCAVCPFKFNINSPSTEDRPRVDHSHQTQVVRGLLCNTCNSGLGKFEDNLDYLVKAAQYLERDYSQIDLKIRSFPYERVQDTKQQSKNRSLKFHYKIGIQGYQWLVGTQEGKCAICSRYPKLGHPLYVDHNHKTNQIRGLLCNPCNRGLGYFKDNSIILKSAVWYLQHVR